MKNPSTPSNSSKLADKLRAKIQEDQAIIDDLIRQQQNAIENALRKSSSDVRHSIEANMADLNRQIRRSLTLRWMPALIVGLSLFLGISAGAWGLTRYLSHRIESQIVEIERLERNAAALKAQGGRIEVVRNREDGHVYLLMPPGTKTYECGGETGRYVCAKLPK